MEKEKAIPLSDNVIKSSLPLQPYNDVTMHIVNSDPSIGEITLGFNERITPIVPTVIK